jgi:N6-L-threonylcarbamoyladenine synthase
MVEELLIKTNYYINKNKIKMLAIGGGVSANKLLREEINKLNYQTYIPEIKFSGDNGAMIAFYAYLLLMKK